MQYIKISDFAIVPGARYRSDGDGSAEEFFEDRLKPLMDQAILKDEELQLDFDGTWGYASSFLSELAKRLAAEYSSDDIDKTLVLKTDSDPSLRKEFLDELKAKY